MALSLVCKQCDTPLRSVAEAQDHGEATGHSQFEESTEHVLNLVCLTCGKPCRSETERELHIKRTGHSDFENRTADAQVIHTEAEMKQAGSALEDYAAPRVSLEASTDAPMVPPEVDVALRQQLENMGFNANLATRALHFSGTSSLEQAVQWIMDHEGQPGIEEPLLVPQGESHAPKRQLSKEEARVEAEELIRKAKIRREREERENEKLREQERIRSGKELAAAKKEEESLQLKRNLELRRIEKAEEARAREKIRLKLEEDKRERRRKLGLPEELSEEEKAAVEAAKAEKLRKEQEAKAKNAPPPPRVTLTLKLRQLLVAMKKAHPSQDEQLKTCWNTLLKYCGNVAQSPSEEKFRNIKLTNAAFQARVGSLTGGIDFLKLLGFEPDASGSALYLPADKVSIDNLTVAGAELSNALTNPFFGAL